MLTKAVLISSLATLAVADFRLFWFREATFVGGAQAYSGMKYFNNPPNCDDFINGAQQDADFDGDVTDSQRGGMTCDGCDSNDWAEWAPSRVEINDFQNNVFDGEPYHITLYGTGNGGYNIHDTDDNVIGSCQMPADPQTVNCGSGFGPYEGYEFAVCEAPMAIQ